jgi:hypothetical protein
MSKSLGERAMQKEYEQIEMCLNQKDKKLYASQG